MPPHKPLKRGLPPVMLRVGSSVVWAQGRSKDGWTPLHLAARHGNTAVAHALAAAAPACLAVEWAWACVCVFGG
jgi:hypothetical protein